MKIFLISISSCMPLFASICLIAGYRSRCRYMDSRREFWRLSLYPKFIYYPAMILAALSYLFLFFMQPEVWLLIPAFLTGVSFAAGIVLFLRLEPKSPATDLIIICLCFVLTPLLFFMYQYVHPYFLSLLK